MKRSPLTRKSPLKGKRKRINPLGKRKKRMREAGEVDGEICRVAKHSPCMLTGLEPPSDPHHTGKTRRDWCPKTGDCFVMPLDHWVHQDYHDMNRAQWFEEYGFDKPTRDEMRRMSKRFGARFVRDGGERP